VKLLVEGLDLAGKSTLSRGLLARIAPQLALRRNALVLDNPVYLFADDLRRARTVDGAVLGPLYVAALELDLQRVVSDTDRAAHVLQDSLVGLRSYCYYAARGDEALAGKFAQMLDDGRHPVFDKAVVLTASIAKRRERLEERRRLAPHEVAEDDLAVEKNPAMFMCMEEILVREAQRRYGALVIDTTEMSQQEVLGAALEAVR
jgi:thymidylate kinase